MGWFLGVQYIGGLSIVMVIVMVSRLGETILGSV